MLKINTPDFSKQFKMAWGSTERNFFKLETLQHYVEDGNPAYEALVAGKMEEAISRIPALLPPPSESTPNFLYERSRLVEWPLSDYTYLEFHVYAYNELSNRHTFVIEGREAFSSRVHSVCQRDFLLFDNETLIVQDYDTTGRLQGAWLNPSEEELDHFRDAAQNIRSIAIPFRQYLEQRNISLREDLLGMSRL